MFDGAAERYSVACGVETFGQFAAFAGVAGSAQQVHGVGYVFVCLFADGAERDGFGYKAFHDGLFRFYLVDGYRLPVGFDVQQVAHEHRCIVIGGQLCECAIEVVVVGLCRFAQGCNGFRVPCVAFAVGAIGIFAAVGNGLCRVACKSLLVFAQHIGGHIVDVDTFDGRRAATEIGVEQVRRYAECFEQFGAFVAQNGRYAHFGDDFFQTFVDGVDVVGACGGVVELQFAAFDQRVECGKHDVGIDGTCSVAYQQGDVHHFHYFAAFDNQGCLCALVTANEVVMYSRKHNERWYGRQRSADALVADNDVVKSVVDGFFGLVAKAFDGAAHAVGTFGYGEHHIERQGAKTFVGNVFQNVEFGVGDDGRFQFYHFAQLGCGVRNVAVDRPDETLQRHDGLFAQRVDGRIGYLCKLLAEIVEKTVRFVRKNGQRRVVAHRIGWLHLVAGHGFQHVFDVLGAVAEHMQQAVVVVDGVAYFSAAFDVAQHHAVAFEPFAVGMFGGKGVFYRFVVENFPLLHVHHNHFAGAQALFLRYVFGSDVEHAGFRCHDECTLFGDDVMAGTQAVAVEYAAGIASIRKEYGRRSVPLLHEYAVIFVKLFQIGS